MTVVEVDGTLVDICKKHYPELANGGFDNSRVRLLIDDGYKYIQKTTSNYDVIIVDVTDPVKAAQSLHTQNFYELCKKRLKPKGVFCTPMGSPITQLQLIKNKKKQLQGLYPSSCAYYSVNPSQIGGLESYLICFSDSLTNTQTGKQIRRRFEAIEPQLRYYSTDIHNASFLLPKCIQERLDQE